MTHPIRNFIIYMILCILHGMYVDLVTVEVLSNLEQFWLLAPPAILYMLATTGTSLALPGFSK